MNKIAWIQLETELLAGASTLLSAVRSRYSDCIDFYKLNNDNTEIAEGLKYVNEDNSFYEHDKFILTPLMTYSFKKLDCRYIDLLKRISDKEVIIILHTDVNLIHPDIIRKLGTVIDRCSNLTFVGCSPYMLDAASMVFPGHKYKLVHYPYMIVPSMNEINESELCKDWVKEVFISTRNSLNKPKILISYLTDKYKYNVVYGNFDPVTLYDHIEVFISPYKRELIYDIIKKCPITIMGQYYPDHECSTNDASNSLEWTAIEAIINGSVIITTPEQSKVYENIGITCMYYDKLLGSVDPDGHGKKMAIDINRLIEHSMNNLGQLKYIALRNIKALSKYVYESNNINHMRDYIDRLLEE